MRQPRVSGEPAPRTGLTWPRSRVHLLPAAGRRRETRRRHYSLVGKNGKRSRCVRLKDADEPSESGTANGFRAILRSQSLARLRTPVDYSRSTVERSYQAEPNSVA